MKVLCVYLAACLALAVAHHDHEHDDKDSEAKDCPSLTEEVLEKLKKQLVTEYVDEQLLGEHSAVYGPKQFLEDDPESCIKTTRTKFDDKIMNQTAYFKNKHDDGGEKTKNGTMEKLENGIYLAKTSSGKPFGKVFMIYAKDNVLAYYICKFNHPKSSEEGKEKEEKKKWKLPFLTSIVVRSKDAKSPLDESVQKNVDEALKKIQADPELFGEIQQHTNFC